MSYYFSKVLKNKDFDEVIQIVTEELKKEGFGVLTEIDVKNTLKNKINIDFKNYKILGACNPYFAHKALTSEDKIGVFLPCNVVVIEQGSKVIEVAAVDPHASMIAVHNANLAEIASEVQIKLKQVIDNLE